MKGRLPRRRIRELLSKLLAWYARSARDLPWRKTRSPYAIWVSEVMLQQTRAWRRSFRTMSVSSTPSPRRKRSPTPPRGRRPPGSVERSRVLPARTNAAPEAARQIERERAGRFPESASELLAPVGDRALHGRRRRQHRVRGSRAYRRPGMWHASSRGSSP